MNNIYVKNPDVIFRKIAEEFVLVPIRQRAVDLKSIFTLNETAAYIWELIDGSRDAEAIALKFSETFEGDPILIKEDLDRILSQFEALTFISRK